MDISILLFLLGLLFQYGNPTTECPVPGVTSLFYFDLEQLSLIALQQGFNSVIQSPKLCKNGKDEECHTQQCCTGEVPCCYNNPNPTSHIRKCGCRKLQDKTCTYPAPYAILANSECETDKKTKLTACLREKRGNEENHILTFNTTVPVPVTKRNSQYTDDYSNIFLQSTFEVNQTSSK